jgi:hypothetical protein
MIKSYKNRAKNTFGQADPESPPKTERKMSKNYGKITLTWKNYDEARKKLLTEYRRRGAKVPADCRRRVTESHDQTAQLERMNWHLNWLDEHMK